MVDITHAIEACDISEAAYVLEMVKSDFPQGTVHIIAVDAKKRSNHPEIVVLHIEGQYFISYNTGLLAMLGDEGKSDIRWRGVYADRHFTSIKGAFGPLAKTILSNGFESLEELPNNKVTTKTLQKPVITDSHISGNVMYFDQRGIAYTNIHETDYDRLTGGKDALIRLTRFETLKTLRKHLADSDPGSAGGFFNERGYLCVGIYHDDTRNMLGFKKGHVIIVENA